MCVCVCVFLYIHTHFIEPISMLQAPRMALFTYLEPQGKKEMALGWNSSKVCRLYGGSGGVGSSRE